MLVSDYRSTSFTIILLSAVFSIAVIFSACSGTESATEDDHHETPEVTQDDLSDLEALYWERRQESRMNFTQMDVDFMYDMIPHHAQALIMSQLAHENEAGQSVRTLASRIMNAQGDEITLMKRWLADRELPVPEIHIDGIDMMVHMDADDHHDHHGHGDHDDHAGHDMHDHSDMPGMLSQEQLEELRDARGSEFDELFLRYMIEHHEGAIIMVNDLFSHDGAGLDREIYDLATGIHAEQVTEIERMQDMLRRY